MGGGTVVRTLVVHRGTGPGVASLHWSHCTVLYHCTGPTVPVLLYWSHCTGITVPAPLYCNGPTVLYRLHCTVTVPLYCTGPTVLYWSRWRLHWSRWRFTGRTRAYRLEVTAVNGTVSVTPLTTSLRNNAKSSIIDLADLSKYRPTWKY